MATINPSQDYDVIHTLTFASGSGTCAIRLYRGSSSEYTGTVYYRAGTSGSWTALNVSGEATTFNVSSTTMQVGHANNKSGDNYMTVSFYGQTTNLTGIAISQKAKFSGTMGKYFMYFYAYGCSSITSLAVPDTSGITSVGTYFMYSYALDCSSLLRFELPAVGWFSSHNIDWSVPSARLGYLKGYVGNSTDLSNWQALTTEGYTLYTNYVQDTGDVILEEGGISASISPSTSKSVSPSVSESASISTSTSESVSPSLSESSSISASTSPSTSASVSPSTSISQSPSISPSTSISVSPSVSESISESISASTSPSEGYQGYTRGDEINLPSGVLDLETDFTEQDYIDVSSKNDVRVSQNASEQYTIFQFKDYVGALNSINIEWEGQTNNPPFLSPVYLQIYNRNTEEWETIDLDNTTDEDVDFILTASIADLTDYKDENTVIVCRIYQQG